MIALAYAIAILLPLFFLYLIYSQDLYGQGKFGHVLLSFGWGLVAFGGAYGIAVLLQQRLEVAFGSRIEAYQWLELWLPVLIAPIVEELLKSLVLIFLAPRMTYFVDGAIYGFSAGIGFSILENVLIYIPREKSGAVAAVLLACVRVLSTCLMHGAASGLVGTAVGRFRYSRRGHRLLARVSDRGTRFAAAYRVLFVWGFRLLVLALGWGLAIGIHMGFNRLARVGEAAGAGWVTLVGSVGIGLGGAVLIILFIRWGLEEEKRWIGETLGIGVGVTKGEVAVVRKYEQIDELLQPIEERFGKEKSEHVEEFLLRQGKLGIKRKTRAMSQEPRERRALDEEIRRLQEEMEHIRRQVGVYCMSYVRTIFPEDALDLTTMLERLVEVAEARGMSAGDEGSMQATIVTRMEQRQQPAGGFDLYRQLGQNGAAPDEEPEA